MKVLRKRHIERLVLNGSYRRYLLELGEEGELPPIIKLDGPGADDLIMLAWIDPTNPDRAFGISKIAGFVTVGELSISNLKAAAKASGTGMVVDEDFESDPFRTLADYVPKPKPNRRYARRAPQSES